MVNLIQLSGCSGFDLISVMGYRPCKSMSEKVNVKLIIGNDY